jgi:putative SOS response-associated peptidase YedK
MLLMCNLYSELKGQAAIRAEARAMYDRTGNIQPMPAIFPDMLAPVVRKGADGERELVMLRWGLPSPPQYVKGIDCGVTNVRNVASPHWRRWTGFANRCVVPATSFCEPSTHPDPRTGKKVWHWFALSEERPLFFFAGFWTTWRGVRGTWKERIDADHQLFGFLTTEANADVFAVHEKAMPAILTTSEEIELWMTGPIQDALALQRPLPDGAVRIVRSGVQEDTVPAA